MNFHEKIDDRKIRSETVERLIAVLTKNAQNPERIGQRVIIMQFILEREKSFPKMLTLAEKLGVSPARASQAVSALIDALEEIRNVNFPTLDKDRD